MVIMRSRNSQCSCSADTFSPPGAAVKMAARPFAGCTCGTTHEQIMQKSLCRSQTWGHTHACLPAPQLSGVNNANQLIHEWKINALQRRAFMSLAHDNNGVLILNNGSFKKFHP